MAIATLQSQLPPNPSRQDSAEDRSGKPASRGLRLWLVAQGLVYLLSGALVMIQALRPTLPPAHRLSVTLPQHPILQFTATVAGAAILAFGIVMVVNGFTQARLRELPRAPVWLRRSVPWTSGVGAVGRGAAVAAGGALVLLEARAGSAADAERFGQAVRSFWQHPYGRPVLFLVGSTLVLFGCYEFAAARYRPAQVRHVTARDGRMTRLLLPRDGRRAWTGAAVLAATWVGVIGLDWLLGTLLVHRWMPAAVLRDDVAASNWFFAHRTATGNQLSAAGSSLADTFTVLAVTTAAVILLRGALGRWRESVALVVAIVGELVFFVTVTSLVHRHRPLVPHLDPAPPTSSYPSGHTGGALALYGTLAVVLFCVVRRRWAAVVLGVMSAALPLAVAVSRVYRGMHYPTDVLGGLLGSGLWVTAVVVILLLRADAPAWRTDRLGRRPAGTTP